MNAIFLWNRTRKQEHNHNYGILVRDAPFVILSMVSSIIYSPLIDLLAVFYPSLSYNRDELPLFDDSPASANDPLAAREIFVDVSASSGLPVSLVTLDSTIAVVASSLIPRDDGNDGEDRDQRKAIRYQLQILSAGSVNLIATQEGDGTYNTALPITRTLTVQRAVPVSLHFAGCIVSRGDGGC